MAKSRKAPVEEDSFYDAFLTSAEEPAQTTIATDNDPSVSVPIAADPPANDTPIATQAASEPSQEQEVAAETPWADVPAQTPVQLANTGRGVGRRRDPDYMQASAYVPRQLRRQVNRALLNDPSERDYSELIEELLQKWLADQGMSV
jgi:hypothetical protein